MTVKYADKSKKSNEKGVPQAMTVTSPYSSYGNVYNGPYGSMLTQMQDHYVYGQAPYGYCAPYGPAAPSSAQPRSASELPMTNFQFDETCRGLNAAHMNGPPVMAPKYSPTQVASSAVDTSDGAGVNLSPSTSIASAARTQPIQRTREQHVEGPFGANLFG